MERLRWASLLFKYFLHGVFFFVLFLTLGIMWAFTFLMWIGESFFISLIIGIIILSFIVGKVNTILASSLWHIPIKSDWKNLLAHGFVLFSVLFMVNIFLYFIISIVSFMLYSSSSISPIALNITPYLVILIDFIIYCFIDGFVSKKVACLWRIRYSERTV